jgi:adenylate cyclase
LEWSLDNFASRVEQLSPRELEIAEAYSNGESYNEIAKRLCIAPSTVRTHLTTIYRKLGVSSKLELHKHLENSAQQSLDRLDEPPTPPDKPSIAVLPFDNMSGDPEQEYFADGMAEDITTALSRSPWLFIIARNTTFTYKGSKIDAKRVAKELGVRYLLEGSVRKAGERIRVTAQLIDGTSGGHVWSERYDRVLDDIFDLQDEITRNVVASIQTQVHLTASEPVLRSRRPDLTVWELTMRGWKRLYDFTPESYAIAKSLLEKAIDHDPQSAEAHLVLSLIYHHESHMGFVHDCQATQIKAHELALRATRLDDNNEYAHWALGISYWGVDGLKESIAALQRAVELNPNCSLAYGSLGTAMSLAGRIDEAIVCSEIAIRSNPRDPSIFFRFTVLSLAHYLAERFDTAIEWADKSVQRMPTWYFGHFVLAASHVRLGKMAEARTIANHCCAVIPDISIGQLSRMPIENNSDMDQFKECLLKAGIPE